MSLTRILNDPYSLRIHKRSCRRNKRCGTSHGSDRIRVAICCGWSKSVSLRDIWEFLTLINKNKVISVLFILLDILAFIFLFYGIFQQQKYIGGLGALMIILNSRIEKLFLGKKLTSREKNLKNIVARLIIFQRRYRLDEATKFARTLVSGMFIAFCLLLFIYIIAVISEYAPLMELISYFREVFFK